MMLFDMKVEYMAFVRSRERDYDQMFFMPVRLRF